MPDRIEPAMPPEEWAAQLERSPEERRKVLLWAVDEADADGYLDIHGLAALCLYGKPYGFTDFHPALLRTVADTMDRINDEERAEELRHLAARIEALLPPR